MTAGGAMERSREPASLQSLAAGRPMEDRIVRGDTVQEAVEELRRPA